MIYVRTMIYIYISRISIEQDLRVSHSLHSLADNDRFCYINFNMNIYNYLFRAYEIGCTLCSHCILYKDKTLGRARDPCANGAWLSKLTERNMKCLS